MTAQDLNEAPASVTYSVITPKGFPALFTLRETTGTALMAKMVMVEQNFEKDGFKPQQRGFGGAPKPVEYVEGVKCPKDGGRIVIKTKKDGGKFWQCENRKWNNATNSAYGCEYIDWDAGKKAFVNPNEDSPMPDNY